ncbi:MAG: hypothetical protein PHT12_06000 [Patescibacteria group bacterium]|nr:hypothetical protein [Patescibacteria group bacterium]
MGGMLASGAYNGQIIAATLAAWAVFALSIRLGKPGWSKTDRFCLALAVLGIILWLVFRNPVFGIVASLVADFLGAIPTAISAWHDPTRENKLAWAIFWLGGLSATLAVPQWTLAHAAQPLVFFAEENLILGIILFRSRLTPPRRPETN